MTGKEKCELLRQIRKELAEKNGIDYNPRECTHTGDCQGTCAVCDMEIRYLDAQLNKKAEMGGRLSVAGVALDKVKVETTGGDMRRNKSWWKHDDSVQLQGQLVPPRDTYPPHVTRTMGIVLPPNDMTTDRFDRKDSTSGSDEDWSWADEDEDV